MAGTRKTTTSKATEEKKEEEAKVGETQAAANGVSEDMLKKFMEIVERQESQIADLNKKLEDNIKKTGVKVRGQVNTDVDLEDPSSYDNDDVLEDPKIYFTYSNGKTLYSYTDVKTRKIIDLPYGVDRPIRFKKVYSYRKLDRTGKGDKVHTVARYVTYSKKEDEFLRNHPYFNISIFESMGEAEAIDSSFATILESTRTMVNKMSNHNVVDRARNLDLPILEDPSEMRKSLIHKLAKQQMDSAAAKNKSYVEDSVQSRDIINK